MGQFFLGNMIGGTIEHDRIEVAGGTVGVAKNGDGSIQIEVVGSASWGGWNVSLWDALMPNEKFIGYIEDKGTMGSFLTACQIKQRTLQPNGNISINAAAIGDYLENRYHVDGTLPLAQTISSGTYSMKDVDFNPTSRVASAWISHAITQLTSRSNSTYTGDKTVPIAYNSSGSLDGVNPTFAYPYNALDYVTVRERIARAFGDQNVLPQFWGVRPVLVGQDFTNNNSKITPSNATTIRWDIYFGTYNFSDEPTVFDLAWSPNGSSWTSLQVSTNGNNISTMVHDSKANNFGGPTQDFVPAYVAPVGGSPIQNLPLAETRRMATFGFGNPRNGGGITGAIDYGQEVWKFTLPRNGYIKPGFQLIGQEIRVRMTGHPVFGTVQTPGFPNTDTYYSLSIDSFELDVSKPDFTVWATRDIY